MLYKPGVAAAVLKTPLALTKRLGVAGAVLQITSSLITYQLS